MSSVPVVRDPALHLERANAHAKTGDVLHSNNDEWFAVAYFYAAYHAVKAALNVDPVFNSLADLTAISPKLTLDVRFAEHHSGGLGQNGRSLGVNDAVFLLYPKIRVEYHRLHMASCHVRYGRGLDTVSPQSVIDDYRKIMKASAAGELVAPARAIN